MSKIGMLLLLLVSITLAWAGPGAQDDENRPCMVTTRSGSHTCTRAEEALLIARQRQVRELYEPRAGQVNTPQELGRTLLRLLGPRGPASETQRSHDLRQLLDPRKPAAPKQ